MFLLLNFLQTVSSSVTWHIKLISSSTVNSRFKKDLKLQIHLHKPFFFFFRFLDSLHKSFLNQTTLDLRKEKWTFLNREFTVLAFYVPSSTLGILMPFGKVRVFLNLCLKIRRHLRSKMSHCRPGARKSLL